MARNMPQRDARGRFVKRKAQPEYPFQRAATRAPIARKPSLWQRIRAWFDVSNVRGRVSLEALRAYDAQ